MQKNAIPVAMIHDIFANILKTCYCRSVQNNVYQRTVLVVTRATSNLYSRRDRFLIYGARDKHTEAQKKNGEKKHEEEFCHKKNTKR